MTAHAVGPHEERYIAGAWHRVYPHLMIVGRQTGDDEDSAKSFENMSIPEAEELFRHFIYANADLDHERYEELVAGADPTDWEEVYVNYIFTSPSPIDITYAGPCD